MIRAASRYTQLERIFHLLSQFAGRRFGLGLDATHELQSDRFGTCRKTAFLESCPIVSRVEFDHRPPTYRINRDSRFVQIIQSISLRS
jgi:hypothetical protein